MTNDLTTSYDIVENDDGNNLVVKFTSWQSLYRWEVGYYLLSTEEYRTTINNNGIIFDLEDY